MDVHRIEIPEEYGGGWVEVKAKRSWRDSNLIEGTGARLRAGVTEAEFKAAQATGTASDLIEIDPHTRIATELITAIRNTSDGIKPAGMSVRAWLDSDEMDEDLGDFLLETARVYYASVRRTAAERKT